MPEVEPTVNLENARKSSLITVGKTAGQRKKSFVSFEEKSETIEVIKVEEEDKEREDDNDEEEECGDVLSRLRSEKEGVKGDDEDDEEEEEEVVAYTRRWTDSLKIKRKKSKQEQEEKGKESS